MNIITISLNKCKIGMITAESVFNDFGGIIIGENIKLNGEMIDRLKNFNINRLKVYVDSIKPTEDLELSQVKETYDNQVNDLKEIVKDINSGKTLDLEKIDNVIGTLTTTFSNDRIIIDCFKLVKDVDEYLYNHCINVSLLSALIGKWIKLDENKINDLAYAGLLHDIGKAKISFKIVNKKTELSDEEKEELKKHVTFGYKMLQSIPNINKDIQLGVLMHHERMDGSGYTLGANGEQIHIYGRILAIASKYDHYVNILKRNPFKIFETMRERTFNELDPDITLTFLKKISEYYIGDIFRLNTGELAEIISINPNDISRPLVKIDKTFVSLAEDRSIEFEELYIV